MHVALQPCRVLIFAEVRLRLRVISAEVRLHLSVISAEVRLQVSTCFHPPKTCAPKWILTTMV